MGTTGHRKALLSLLVGLVLVTLTGSLGQAAAGRPNAVLIVDRGDDASVSDCTAAADDCTLRGAIEYANSHGTDNVIRFDPTVQEVLLEDRLPDITSPGTVIEGTDPGGTPFYPVINGVNISGMSGRWVIDASDVSIQYLSIINLPQYSAGLNVEISTATGVVIAHNYLGVTPQTQSCSEAGLVQNATSAIRLAGALSGAAGPGNGTAYIYGNVIGCHRWNGGDGIELVDSNWVYIGEDPTGVVVPNYVGTDASNHDLGSDEGIAVAAYLDNDDLAITIGPNWVAHNLESGIDLHLTNTVGVLITGTTIYGNGGAGIRERKGAVFNHWSHVSLYDNGGLGIDTDDEGVSSGTLPRVTAVNVVPDVISGTASASTPPFFQVDVELYRVAPDPSGHGEGKTYVGRATVDAEGHWAITDPAGADGCYTAFQTSRFIGLTLVFASSEFGPNSCRGFLPLVVR
jgi:hypothetical protein